MTAAVASPARDVRARPARAVRRFGFDDLVVQVTAAAEHVAWLEEFLAPQFDVLAPGAASVAAAHATVDLCEDRELYEALLAAGPLPGEDEIDGFALDNSVIRFAVWRSSPGGRTLRDPDFPIFYRVMDGPAAGAPCTRFELVTPGGDLAVRTPLMRVVREIAMGWSLRRGGLFLHASAVAFGRRGLVLAGNKAAGKTTLLIHLLRQPGASYLSNDRVLVRRTNAQLELRGMPTIATIRPGTLTLLPELDAKLGASGFQHRLSLAEVAAQRGGRAQPWRDGRHGVSPAQLCRLTDAPAQSTADCAALLFPSITGAPGGLEIAPVAPDAAAVRLADALFGIRTWRKSSDLFGVGDGGSLPEPDALEALCRQLTASVPCWECRLGEASYLDHAATTRALARLLV